MLGKENQTQGCCAAQFHRCEVSGWVFCDREQIGGYLLLGIKLQTEVWEKGFLGVKKDPHLDSSDTYIGT